MPGWRTSRIVARSNTPASSGAGRIPAPITNAGGAGHDGGGQGVTGAPTFRLEPLMTGSAMPGWHWASGTISGAVAATGSTGPTTGPGTPDPHSVRATPDSAGAGRNAAGTAG
jgi:hypothetical protein